MNARIMILDGGLHHERAFAWLQKAALQPVHRARRKVLLSYDIIFVPFHTDQIALAALKPSLKAFLHGGGVLVILGATEEGGRNWIPYCQWQSPFTQDVDVVDRSSPDGQVLFKNLESSKDLQYHGIYYAHGALLHQDGQALATTGDGRTVMLVRRRGLRGTLLCTTLDPDFHSVSVVPGPNLETTSQTHDKAGMLLRNIVEWSEHEYHKKPLWLRLFRRIMSPVRRTASGLSYWILLLLSAGTLFYLQVLQSSSARSLSSMLLTALSSVTLVGAIMDVWQRWQSYRSERK